MCACTAAEAPQSRPSILTPCSFGGLAIANGAGAWCGGSGGICGPAGAVCGLRTARPALVRRLPPRPRPAPETLEGGAALIGRVLAPEELAHDLVVQTDEGRGDERGVRAHERRRVGRDELEPRQEPVAAELAQRFPHRVEELRACHDR